VKDRPTLVGSRNALAGMKLHYAKLVDGADPLDVAIEVVKVQEADPEDNSVGLGGIPNEAGVVQLDAAVMHGPTHNSGAVACIEDTLHPSEVARLVMERSDHCMIVGTGAREFARMHGHPAVNLLTEASREAWLAWKETMSDQDDRLPPREKEKHGRVLTINGEAYAVADLFGERRPTGTIHCSALARNGDGACTTTTWACPSRSPAAWATHRSSAPGCTATWEPAAPGRRGAGSSPSSPTRAP
jgi:N4-(beta-N-acetylglucosaminyl)-L-asparaginase